VSTDPFVGLTDAHVEELIEWADRLENAGINVPAT
jgi:hypothetical protein